MHLSTYLPTLPNLAAAARTWSTDSQQVARRNAMLAATQCAQRRAERQDVADYFAGLPAAQAPSADVPVRAAQR
jgi:hypothetical protein